MEDIKRIIANNIIELRVEAPTSRRKYIIRISPFPNGNVRKRLPMRLFCAILRKCSESPLTVLFIQKKNGKKKKTRKRAAL